MDTYEKKYNEALQRAKEIKSKILYSHLSTESCKAVSEYIDEIIPELRESEEERIRKGLVKLLTVASEAYLVESTGIKKDSYLAYLEKQKEPTPADGWDYADKRMSHPLYWEGFEAGRDVERELSEFEKQKEPENVSASTMAPSCWAEEPSLQKEQKHPNGCFTCDEYKKGYEEGRRNGFTAGYNKAMKEVEQKEQKPVDYEAELKKCKDNPLYFYDKYVSIKQKPAEWSEEDENRRDGIIQWLCEYKKEFNPKYDSLSIESIESLINWLKSLRPPKDCSDCAKHLEGYISGRSDAENKLLDQFGILITPEGELHMKPRWKPSEEQMVTLLRAEGIVRVHDTKELAADLAQLYEQLKSIY